MVWEQSYVFYDLIIEKISLINILDKYVGFFSLRRRVCKNQTEINQHKQKHFKEETFFDLKGNERKSDLQVSCRACF